MLEKSRQSMSNMVAKSQARARERAAWRESNALRFGTNWEVVVYGTNDWRRIPLVPQNLPIFTVRINSNAITNNPGVVTREKLVCMARRGITDHGKTDAEKLLYLEAFDRAITNGFVGTTNGLEHYSVRTALQRAEEREFDR